MISILLSCYNSNMGYLAEQVNSIIGQTCMDWELLIYNDGTERLKEFYDELHLADFYDHIKYFDEGHKGCVGAFNYLLEKAKGEYICICDHDDVWQPYKLEMEKKYLDEHPEVDCVFGWLQWFGEKNKLESFSISDEQISKDLYFYQPVKNPTVMFRKSRFGLNDCPFDKASDFWYWAKHKDRHYHLIEKVLVNYRRHSGELTKDKELFRINSWKVIQKNLQERFDFTLPLECCKILDKFSCDYNDDVKRLIESFL